MMHSNALLHEGPHLNNCFLVFVELAGLDEDSFEAESDTVGGISKTVKYNGNGATIQNLRVVGGPSGGAGLFSTASDYSKLGAELDRENGGGLAGALDNISRLDPDAINNLLIRIDDVMVVMDRLSAVLERIGSLFGH